MLTAVIVPMPHSCGVAIFARGTRRGDIVFTGCQGPGNNQQDEGGPIFLGAGN